MYLSASKFSSGGATNSRQSTIHSFFTSTSESSQDSPVMVSAPQHSVTDTSSSSHTRQSKQNIASITQYITSTSSQDSPVKVSAPVTDTSSRPTNSHTSQPKHNIALITQYFSPVKLTDQQEESDDLITESTTPPVKKRKLEVSNSVAQDNSPFTSAGYTLPLTSAEYNSPSTSVTVEPDPDDLVFRALPDSEDDCVPPPTCVGLSEGPIEMRTSTSEFLPSDLDSCENLAPELLTVCGVCGCRVAVWAEQEHADYHLALQLQQEDREQLGERGKNEKRVKKEKRTRGSSILDFVVR